MARRLADGALVDPYGGEADLERARAAHRLRRNSFAEDPLRIVRGLRFVSQLDLDPDDATLAQMREEARGVALVSGERIGGGLPRTAWGSSRSSCSARIRRKALRIARDTGVLVQLLPEFERGDRVRRRRAATTT